MRVFSVNSAFKLAQPVLFQGAPQVRSITPDDAKLLYDFVKYAGKDMKKANVRSQSREYLGCILPFEGQITVATAPHVDRVAIVSRNGELRDRNTNQHTPMTDAAYNELMVVINRALEIQREREKKA